MTSLFAGLQFENIAPSLGSISFWIIASLLGLGFLIWTYWGIFQRSERRLAWFLFALRTTGLLALWLTLAKPVWTGANEKIDAGRVAVIVDNSISMRLVGKGSESRYALASSGVEKLKRALDSRSGAATIVDLYDIQGNLLSDGLKPEPLAERTDLVQAIREVVVRSRAKALTSIVLISDGMDNSGRTDFRGELAEIPVGIFTVGYPKQTISDLFDLAVKKPQVPAKTLVNNELSLEVPISKLGGEATSATLSLRRGSEVITSKSIDLSSGNVDRQVQIKFTPTQAGSFIYTLQIESPTPEPILLNNAVSFPLQVDAEPIRVLYLEGAMRWEFKYLKNRFEDDPDVSLATVLRRINPERTEPRPMKESLTPERLKNLDVIILGDMEAKFLAASEYDSLLKWLDQKNHSLLVLGGYRSFGPEGWQSTELAKALPVVFADAEPFQKEGPFILQLTDEGKRHPAFVLSEDRIKDLATWEEQARLEGLCLVKRAKPAATILAVHPELKIDGEPAVVACWQNYGGGKVMVLTVDTTWEWSRTPRLIGRADTLYGRFWSQTLRWLAGRNVDEQRPLLTLTTDKSGYEPGKQVQLKATRQPRPEVDFTNSEMTAEVKRDGKPLMGSDGKPVPVNLQASSASPDEFTAKFTPTLGGRYQVEVRLAAGSKLLANQSAEFLVQGEALELSDPRTDPDMLQRISDRTGGKFVEIDQIESLAKDLPQKERRRVQIDKREFWNSPWLFAIFLTAVGTEWYLRRRNQMV